MDTLIANFPAMYSVVKNIQIDNLWCNLRVYKLNRKRILETNAARRGELSMATHTKVEKDKYRKSSVRSMQ